MNLRRDNRGQMMILDALVFFMILSTAAAVPPVLMSQRISSADTADFAALQGMAGDSLAVLLQCTLPVVLFPEYPADGEKNGAPSQTHKNMFHMPIDEGLQLQYMGMYSGASRETYESFEREVNKTLKGILPVGYRAWISITGSQGESFAIGKHPPLQINIGSAHQHYPGTGVTIVMGIWKM